MNPNHEHELEALVDRELKSLPPISAPTNLAPRILAAIAARAEAPWYRCAWQTWPLALRLSSLAVLMAVFAALCLGGGKATQLAGTSEAAQKVNGLLALLHFIWNTVAVLLDALSHVIQHLGTGVVFAAVAVMVLTYAVFLALGSACVRFAFVRR
jgi:hypothetical protein